MIESEDCLTDPQVKGIVSANLIDMRAMRDIGRNRYINISGNLDYSATIKVCFDLLDSYDVYHCGGDSYQLNLSLRGSDGRYSIFVDLDNNREIIRISLFTPQGYISYEPPQ